MLPTKNIKSKPYRIEALLLAAGESKRFNGIKQLATIDEKPMLAHTLSKLLESEFDAITVVLGANASAIKVALDQINVELANTDEVHSSINSIIAANWRQGMGASIAAGVKNLAQEMTHVFIGLNDQVEIRAEQCNLMIAESQKYPDKIVAAFYNGKVSAPAIFPRVHFADLALLSDDKGARVILRSNMANIISIVLPEGAKDIDTRTDLRSYLSTKKS
jgi:molybdenum cofactor cytidylyltransferase